jgi:hypothetical protein
MMHAQQAHDPRRVPRGLKHNLAVFREIVRAGETYAYDREMDEPTGRRVWMIEPARKDDRRHRQNRSGGRDRHRGTATSACW